MNRADAVKEALLTEDGRQSIAEQVADSLELPIAAARSFIMMSVAAGACTEEEGDESMTMMCRSFASTQLAHYLAWSGVEKDEDDGPISLAVADVVALMGEPIQNVVNSLAEFGKGETND